MVITMAMKTVTGKLRKGGGKGLSGDALVGNVRQSTINDIKRMGMTKALQLAGSNGNTAGGLAREFNEGVRRMYGAKRLEAAKAAAKAKAPMKKGSYQAGSAKSGKATYTTGSGVKYKSSGTSSTKPVAKKNNTKSNLLKGVAGTAAAVGVLALTRGKGAGLAAKLSPGLAKSGVGRAVLGGTNQAARKVSNAKMMATDKALSTSGRVSAKTTKTVSQSQYDAMKSAAAARGVKPVAKTATKLTTKKKAGLAGAGAGGVTTGKKK